MSPRARSSFANLARISRNISRTHRCWKRRCTVLMVDFLAMSTFSLHGVAGKDVVQRPIDVVVGASDLLFGQESAGGKRFEILGRRQSRNLQVALNVVDLG